MFYLLPFPDGFIESAGSAAQMKTLDVQHRAFVRENDNSDTE